MPTPNGWWTFDSVLTDSSGNGNTLTNNSATFGASAYRPGVSAVVTDGVSQYLSLTQAGLSSGYPHKFGEVTTAFTVGGWVQYPTTPVDGTRFYAMADTSHVALTLRTNGGFFETEMYTGVANAGCASDAAYVVGQWYHVVVRWLGATSQEVVLFINGAKQTPTTASASVSAGTTCPLVFGCIADDVPRGFTAVKLYEWFGFNSALTDRQIASIAATGLAGFVIGRVSSKRQSRAFPFAPGSPRRRS